MASASKLPGLEGSGLVLGLEHSVLEHIAGRYTAFLVTTNIDNCQQRTLVLGK